MKTKMFASMKTNAPRGRSFKIIKVFRKNPPDQRAIRRDHAEAAVGHARSVTATPSFAWFCRRLACQATQEVNDPMLGLLGQLAEKLFDLLIWRHVLLSLLCVRVEMAT